MQRPHLIPMLALLIACVPGTALAIDPAQTTRPPVAAPATAPVTAPAPTTTPAPAATTPPATAPASAPATATTAGDDDEAAMKAPPPKATGATPQKFNPTEKVRADYPVAFPIDI